MLPTAWTLLLVSQFQAVPLEHSLCPNEWQLRSAQCERVPLPCDSREIWDAQLEACKPKPPSESDCFADGMRLDPTRQQCTPVHFSAYCYEHNWEYEQEQTISRIVNDLGAHDCDEAEEILEKSKVLRLHAEGYLKVTDLRPLRALPFLEEIYLDGQNISDLGPLAHLKLLRRISLRNNEVYNLSPLLGLRGLEFLDITGNLVKNNDADLQQLRKRVKVMNRDSQESSAN